MSQRMQWCLTTNAYLISWLDHIGQAEEGQNSKESKCKPTNCDSKKSHREKWEVGVQSFIISDEEIQKPSWYRRWPVYFNNTMQCSPVVESAMGEGALHQMEEYTISNIIG